MILVYSPIFSLFEVKKNNNRVRGYDVGFVLKPAHVQMILRTLSMPEHIPNRLR